MKITFVCSQNMNDHGEQSDKDLEALAKQLKEKLDIQDLRRSMRMDLDRALKANEYASAVFVSTGMADIHVALGSPLSCNWTR